MSSTSLTTTLVIYLFFPETARLSLEEIAKNFGEEVAVNLTDATEEERKNLERTLAEQGPDTPPAIASDGTPSENGNEKKV